MSAILEMGTVSAMSDSSSMGPNPPLARVRQFALGQISARLNSDPALVGSFWAQIGDTADHPDITVLYGAVRHKGTTFALLEFVAGETLEEFVKTSDPSACEQEIPLFCRILDAFEGPTEEDDDSPAPSPEFELLDFGVARASASLTSKLHGAILSGPEGTWSDAVYGEYGASRSQVFGTLMELCSKLPGNLPRTVIYGPRNLGACAVCSLAEKPPASEAQVAPTAAAPKPVAAPQTEGDAKPDKRGFQMAGLLARIVAPYLIAILTAALVLMAFYQVGGYLAKRNVSSDAGKLILPPMAPIEAETSGDAVLETAAAPVAKAKQAAVPRKTRMVAAPVPSIIVTRGAKPIRQTDLAYPLEAQKENVTGVVEMQLTIAEDGSVQSPRVVSGDPLLRAGLTEEVSKWVYQPMRVNGKAVPMTTELAIRFNLN